MINILVEQTDRASNQWDVLDEDGSQISSVVSEGGHVPVNVY